MAVELPSSETVIDELGELLYEIGWRPTADAQFDRLRSNVGRLQTVLGKITDAHHCVECGWIKSRELQR